VIKLSSLIFDLSFIVTYVIPIASVLVASYGILLARKEKLNGSERMLQGLRDQLTVNDLLLKLIENSIELVDSEFRKSLLDQIELIRIVLQHYGNSNND
jgi:fructose-1,6-bisphosphatase